ncbi:3-dehydrosphinganine reductase [Sporobolomyces salmoneus]|uniref:3-dehydrosphinganine reductase n=1 Tax=Sporobolomyces salmoneus TaxID=183962 RepID=UPI00317197F2
MSSYILASLSKLISRAISSPTAVVFTLISSLVSVLLMKSLFRSSRFNPAGKHCYIGGGSEGLGLSLACQLAARGANVSIVSRSQAKLDKALEEIESHRQNPQQIFKAYACDLTNPSAAASTLRTACKAIPSSTSSNSPDYVFACAGGCVPGMFTSVSAEKQWECMEWNFRTCLNTIHEAVVAMKESGDRRGGKVVLTSSVLALMSFAGYSTYSPSKYAIRGLAESLRNELILYNIDVHLFLPATIFSPGFENEQKLKPEITKKIEGPDEGLTPDQVAKELIKGLERDDFYITYEPVGHMFRNSRGITPRNNFLIDSFWSLVGTIALPVWGWMSADGEVKKEAKRLAAVSERP